jgi:uncharacterized membrane-anchored protein
MRATLKSLLLASALVAAPALAQAPIESPPAAQAPAAPSPAPTEAAAPPTDTLEAQHQQRIELLISKMNPRTGEVALPSAKSKLTIPAGYSFFDSKDSRTWLVDIWGNPESSSGDVLGIIMADDSNWAAVIQFEDSGYVSDKDASSINYTELLHNMQDGARAESELRVQDGFPSVELVGWAEPPRYEADTHRLYWAKDLIFGGSGQHELNFDMRLLGRHGVLTVQFLAGIEDLEAVKAAAPRVLEMAAFDEGARYTDFQAGLDKEAGYGIAGLIGGAAALGAAKKIGLLGILLAFLKKGWMLLVLAFGGLARLFGGKKSTPEE